MRVRWRFPDSSCRCLVSIAIESNRPVDCWNCDYQSSAYSPAAVTCDGLDSDYDGMSDQGCIRATGQSKLYVVAASWLVFLVEVPRERAR